MARGSDKDEVCKKALDRCQVDLVNDMNAKDVLDFCIQYNVIPAVKCRDIQGALKSSKCVPPPAIASGSGTNGTKRKGDPSPTVDDGKKQLLTELNEKQKSNCEELLNLMQGDKLIALAHSATKQTMKDRKEAVKVILKYTTTPKKLLEMPKMTKDTLRYKENLTGTMASDKNRMVLQEIRMRGPKAYEKFKKCLHDSSQGHLADKLEEQERIIMAEKGTGKSHKKGPKEPKPPPPKPFINIAESTNLQIGDNNKMVVGIPGFEQGFVGRPDNGRQSTSQQRNRPARGTLGTSEQRNKPANANTGTSEQRNRPAGATTGTSEQRNRPVSAMANTSQQMNRQESGTMGTSEQRNRPADTTAGTSEHRNRPVSVTANTSQQMNRQESGTMGTSEQRNRPAIATAGTSEQRNRPVSGTATASQQINRQESGTTSTSQQINRPANSSQSQVNQSAPGSQVGHAGQRILDSNTDGTGRESQTTNTFHAGEDILSSNVEKMLSNPALPLPSTTPSVDTRNWSPGASMDTDNMSMPNEYPVFPGAEQRGTGQQTENKHLGVAEHPISSNMNAVPDKDNDEFGNTSVISPNNSLAQDVSRLKINDEEGTDEVDTSQPETILVPHPGRIVNMKAEEIEKKIGKELQFLKKGGFGEIYKSKRHLFGLRRDIIVKKIAVNINTNHRRSACNEKLTSHLYHFAIVPSLAWAEEDGHHYFIYPWMENGDLNTALEKRLIKAMATLVRILLQVASAIEFLHTPVDSYRGQIIHSDITTQNILLDEKFNARLTDFGLCRDLKRTNTGTISHTDGYYVPKVGEKLTVKADYFNFGVVCRECLTGKKPVFNNTYLRLTLPNAIKKYWKEFNKCLTDENYTEDCFNALARLSKLCLEEHSGNIFQVVEKIFEEECCVPKFRELSNSSVCLLCMVNEAEADSAILKEECKRKGCRNMAVCIKCKQNSYVNPITCCDCLEEITSVIGKDWCALLIAGNESEEKKAKSFTADIEAVKAILLSKIPTIIGMNESRVELVTPKNPGTDEKMTDRVKDAFQRLKDKKPKTFLFYYSGEKTESSQEGNQKESGLLQLGSKRDTLAVEGHGDIDSNDKNTLQKLLTSVNADRYFIFMDCCYPHKIEIKGKKVLQINPESDKRAEAGEHMSPFTEAFILGLSGRSGLFECPYGNSCNACKNQDQSFSKTFITVSRLFDFIKMHQQVPNITLGDSISMEEMIMAYYINKKEEYVFTFKSNDCASFEKDDIIPADFRSQPKDMKALKKILFNTFQDKLKWKISEKSKAELSDVIMISEVFGPKRTHRLELMGLKQLQEAFDAKRTIEVELRPDDEIVHGKVAKFGCTDDVLEFLKTLENVDRESDNKYRIMGRDLLDVHSSAEEKQIEACCNLFEKWWDNQGIHPNDSVVLQFYPSETEDFFTCHIEKSE